MKDLAKKSLRLGIIGAVAALLLATVNSLTAPIIERYRTMEIQAALTSIARIGEPGTMEEHPASGVKKRWSIEPARGWILEIEAKGYGGKMTLLASYTMNGTLIAAKLLSNNETVGFGKNAEVAEYMDIFVGKGAGVPIPLTKGELGERKDMVAGATITFSGIAKAILLGSELVKQWKTQQED